MELPAEETFLSVQMKRYRLMSLKYSYLSNYFLSLAFALKFFTIEHSPITISSIELRSAVSIFDFEIPRIYCLLSAAGSRFERDDSFPLEDGLRVGSYSTFF